MMARVVLPYYENFDVRIEKFGEGYRTRVSAASSGDGEAIAELSGPFDQLDGFVAHASCQRAVESNVRALRRDAVELEATETMHEVFAGKAKLRRRAHHGSQQVRAFMRHGSGRFLARDDFGADDKLIAVPMIAIVMRVKDGADARVAGAGETVKHGARVRQVEHGVDEQRFAAVGDETRIGQAPAAIRLQIGEAALSQIAHARFVARFRK